MNRSTKLFRIFGIDVQLHYSWWLVFFLLSWSLSSSFFPEITPGYNKSVYWGMGIIAALCLFISVLLHELCHSLVAKMRKIKVESITLFFFGGVAGITKEEMNPLSEFLMAVAGPLFSGFLAGILYMVHVFNGNSIVAGVTFYLYQLNFIIALFNLIPGFPLDGGRAFRAVLYKYYGNLRKATRIAATVGRFFAGTLVIIGIFGIFSGIANGWWLILLGGFLYFIAGASYEQVIVREVLKHISAKEMTTKNIPVVDSSMKISDFVKKYSSTSEDAFFVRKGKAIEGIIDVSLLQRLVLDPSGSIRQCTVPLTKLKVIAPQDDAYVIFQKLNEQGMEILPVMEKRKIIGAVKRNSLVKRLFWELDFPKKRKHFWKKPLA